jgi:hypothetical protein
MTATPPDFVVSNRHVALVDRNDFARNVRHSLKAAIVTSSLVFFFFFFLILDRADLILMPHKTHFRLNEHRLPQLYTPRKESALFQNRQAICQEAGNY